MSYEKLGKLVERLIQNTNGGKIVWEETERSGVYSTAFPKYSVLIDQQPETATDYASHNLSIINEEGDIIEHVAGHELSQVITDGPSVMKSLYDIARRQAKGVEQALDEILGDLPDQEDWPF